MALFAPEKGHSTEMKKVLVRMEMGNLLKEKGTYRILIGVRVKIKRALIRGQWHLREREGGYLLRRKK